MQLEYDIAEYILTNPELCTEAKEFIDQLCLFSGHPPNFTDEFNEQYKALLLYQISNKLSGCFSLNSEDLYVIITEEFITKLLGKDFFKYEYSN